MCPGDNWIFIRHGLSGGAGAIVKSLGASEVMLKDMGEITLQWHHNERHSVSNHWRIGLLAQPFFSGAVQRKHLSSASLAFMRGIHRLPINKINVALKWRTIIISDYNFNLVTAAELWGSQNHGLIRSMLKILEFHRVTINNLQNG